MLESRQKPTTGVMKINTGLRQSTRDRGSKGNTREGSSRFVQSPKSGAQTPKDKFKRAPPGPQKEQIMEWIHFEMKKELKHYALKS